MDFPDDGQMRRRRFDNPTEIQYETHTGHTLSEFMMILGNDPREFYYEFQFSKAKTFPKRVFFVGKGVER